MVRKVNITHGVSFDAGQVLSTSERNRLWNTANSSRSMDLCRSTYVLIAQDDLNTLGYKTGGLDGIFGGRTEEAVRNYQRSRGLAADGIVGCNTWRSLQEDVVGTGRTSITID